MDVIQESAEHHFLTFLDTVKPKADGWYGLHLSMSKKLVHDDLISDLRELNGLLEKQKEECLKLLDKMQAIFSKYSNVKIYLFADNDILVLIEVKNVKEQDELLTLLRDTADKYGPKLCEFANVAQKFYHFQKFSDKKFLTALRIEAYDALCDDNRVSSVSVRRKRRKDPVVLVVEDDRFTATYAANILNKEYEVVSAKTGEEAIIKHIDHAPDLVFLDIHLPGLNGHETLSAIKKADLDAFVVMLSVDTVKSNIVSATQSGAAGFLKKPFTKDRLLHAANQSPFIRSYKSSGS
jgi:CheY-like chemotaxis protein